MAEVTCCTTVTCNGVHSCHIFGIELSVLAPENVCTRVKSWCILCTVHNNNLRLTVIIQVNGNTINSRTAGKFNNPVNAVAVFTPKEKCNIFKSERTFAFVVDNCNLTSSVCISLTRENTGCFKTCNLNTTSYCC